MAESVTSEIVGSESETNLPLDRLAGFGSLLGVAASVLGLVSLAAVGMVPAGLALEIPAFGLQLTQNQAGIGVSGAFVILLAVGLLLQYRGAKVIGSLTESNTPLRMIFTAVVTLSVALAILSGTGVLPTESSPVEAYMGSLAVSGSVFIIVWQFNSVVYIDSSKSYWGMLAGLMNGFFLPMLAVSPALGYLLLLGGQLAMFQFWWGPRSQIREYARSTDTAKFGFGLSGFVTFLLGGAAALGSALQVVDGTPVWLPWSSGTTVGPHVVFTTAPYLVGSILSSMLFWSLLGPRLGAKETPRVADIRGYCEGRLEVLDDFHGNRRHLWCWPVLHWLGGFRGWVVISRS